MHVDNIANLRLVCFGAVKSVVDGKEVTLGKLVGPFNIQRLARSCFYGWSGKATVVSPETRGRQIAMELDQRLAHRNTIQRRCLGLAPLRRFPADALRDRRKRQRINELFECVGIQRRSELR